MSGIVEAVRGDGRTGRDGFVSTLKDRIRDSESGIGAPFDLKGELGPPRLRLILYVATTGVPFVPAMILLRLNQ